jgi:hypothetical protein
LPHTRYREAEHRYPSCQRYNQNGTQILGQSLGEETVSGLTANGAEDKQGPPEQSPAGRVYALSEDIDYEHANHRQCDCEDLPPAELIIQEQHRAHRHRSRAHTHDDSTDNPVDHLHPDQQT